MNATEADPLQREFEERTDVIALEERFRVTIDVLRRELQPGAKVIEIGASQATFRQFLGIADWTTVDKFGEPDVRVDLDGTGTALPWEDASVDAILCTEVLEHLASGSALLGEFARILRPGAGLYVTVPNMVSLSCRIKWLLGRVPYMAAGGDIGQPLAPGISMNGRWVGGHVVDFNRARLDRYLERCGLRVATSYRMPLTIGRWLRVPPGLTPPGLADFVFVKAVRRCAS